MSVPVQRYLKARRDRALGATLGHCERADWYQRLTAADRDVLRRVVIDALNSYHDSVLDLVKAEDDSVQRNEEVIALLERIEAHTRLSRVG